MMFSEFRSRFDKRMEKVSRLVLVQSKEPTQRAAQDLATEIADAVNATRSDLVDLERSLWEAAVVSTARQVR